MHQIKSIQRLFVSCRESVHTSAPTRDCTALSPEWRWKDPALALAPTRVYIPQLSPHCHRSFAALSPVAGRRPALSNLFGAALSNLFGAALSKWLLSSPKVWLLSSQCLQKTAQFGLLAFGPLGLWALRSVRVKILCRPLGWAASSPSPANVRRAAAERERRGGGRRRSQSSEQRRSGWAAIGAATARWAAAAHRAQEQRRASSTSRFLILQFLPSWINGSWYRLKIVGEVKIGCEVKIVSGENRCRGENSAEVKIVSGEKSLSDETGVRWK